MHKLLWYLGLNQALKQKRQIAQNKLVRLWDLTMEAMWAGLQYQLSTEQLQPRVVHRVLNSRAPSYFADYFTNASHRHNTRAN